MKKALSILGVAVGSGSAITKDDLLFILGLVVTIINAVIYYLEHKKNTPESSNH